MVDLQKVEPLEAARKFINKHYPTCQGALLSGSVARGEATKTSDLDIIVFDPTVLASYRESLLDLGWHIEVFVHNLHSYRVIFENDYKRARPSMQRMVVEGLVLRDKGIIETIKNEARGILLEGPDAWSNETVNIKRYFISDALDDFKGSANRSEELFIANTLADLVSEFVLRTNRKWLGSSKWVVRSLKEYNEGFAENFVEAFDSFYKNGNKKQVIHMVEEILEPFGGTYFEGFSMGK